MIAAGLEVLDAVAARDGGFSLIVDHYDWGSDWYRKHGGFMPADALAWLRTADAIYFGAVGDPNIPDHITLWGLRLPICQGFDQYANVRPTRILPGVTSPLRDVGPGDLDWVIVRENSEGEYAGQGGRTHRGLPEEVATETAIFTRRGVERIMRFAFDIARSRPRKHLTVVTKSNAQRHGMVFWDEIAALVSHDYKDVTWDKELVDAMTMRMVRKPRSIDTVVATNLHADILSDLAAALAGSLGIAPTGNIDPERRSPSMFEPIHGSAFDITGKGIANPVATLLDRGDDAGASRREAGRRSADARGRAGLRRRDPVARPGRQGDHEGGDGGGGGGGARDEPLISSYRNAVGGSEPSPARRVGSNGARSSRPVRPSTRSASNRPARGPIVRPAAPRPLPTARPSTAGTQPSSGRTSGRTGRKPIRVSIIVAAPRPGATPNASDSTSACPAAVTR